MHRDVGPTPEAIPNVVAISTADGWWLLSTAGSTVVPMRIWLVIGTGTGVEIENNLRTKSGTCTNTTNTCKFKNIWLSDRRDSLSPELASCSATTTCSVYRSDDADSHAPSCSPSHALVPPSISKRAPKFERHPANSPRNHSQAQTGPSVHRQLQRSPGGRS